jgi:phage gp36-like protein
VAYATQDDLVPLRLTQKDLIELTDDSDSGRVNAVIVTAALEEASGRVESYCRQRYITPLQQSDDVKALTLDIAVYLLFSRRRETRVGETVQQRFDQAIAFLRDIAAGKASLDQPATALQPQQASGEAVVTRKHERFSDRNIDGYSGSNCDEPTSYFPTWWGI